MADPHNPARANEEWNPQRLKAQHEEIEALKDIVVISGGWAWHFMAPEHKELKWFHDHSDIDLFVAGEDYMEFLQRMNARGFVKKKTKYDDPSGSFIRFVKYLDIGKVILDVFIEDLPPNVKSNGVRVVDPKHLLSLYGKTHQSEQCVSVQAARRLVAKGEEVIGNVSLITHLDSG
jgi:hypothetical protein